MGPGNGRMWASAPTGAMDGADLCARSATGFPRSAVGADALVGPRQPPGQRQREAWQNAGAAPAERGHKGILNLPGPKDFPRTSRFISTSTGKGQPSPAGGRRYALCADRPAEAIFSLGPSTAQPLAALPLTDAAYPLRVRPVCLWPKCRRLCGGWPSTRACERSLFVKNKWGPRASPAKRVAWGKAEQRERAQFSPQAETELSGLCDAANGGRIAAGDPAFLRPNRTILKSAFPRPVPADTASIL